MTYAFIVVTQPDAMTWSLSGEEVHSHFEIPAWKSQRKLLSYVGQALSKSLGIPAEAFSHDPFAIPLGERASAGTSLLVKTLGSVTVDTINCAATLAVRLITNPDGQASDMFDSVADAEVDPETVLDPHAVASICSFAEDFRRRDGGNPIGVAGNITIGAETIPLPAKYSDRPPVAMSPSTESVGLAVIDGLMITRKKVYFSSDCQLPGAKEGYFFKASLSLDQLADWIKRPTQRLIKFVRCQDAAGRTTYSFLGFSDQAGAQEPFELQGDA
jgi:hypothetical protein